MIFIELLDILYWRLTFISLIFVRELVLKYMKKETHPENYREVIFLDTSSGEKFLLWSTIETEEKDKWEDGKEYPLAKVEISSASHPFYTGKETVVDTAGRVERFKSRLAKAQPKASKKSKTSKKSEKGESQEPAGEKEA